LAQVANRIILFGGASNEEGLYSQLYNFDIKTTKWSNIPTSEHTPCPRYEHACLSIQNEMLVTFN
jgi:hypothetical protein